MLFILCLVFEILRKNRRWGHWMRARKWQPADCSADSVNVWQGQKEGLRRSKWMAVPQPRILADIYKLSRQKTLFVLLTQVTLLSFGVSDQSVRNARTSAPIWRLYLRLRPKNVNSVRTWLKRLRSSERGTRIVATFVKFYVGTWSWPCVIGGTTCLTRRLSLALLLFRR